MAACLGAFSCGGQFSLLVFLLATWSWTPCGSMEVVSGDNFTQLTSGNWMVEFYAPWCPACKQFAETWKAFAEWIADEEYGMRVGQVDVTVDSVLSGQFMVTQLPTIFHIHDGEVRPYSGRRSLAELKVYVEKEEWRTVEAIPWWKSPTATHMRALGVTYWLSQKGKDMQTMLEQEYNLPTYGVFIIIAVATIVIGLLLGGITVCCIEVFIRLCSRKQTAPPSKLPREQTTPPSKSSQDKPKPTPPREEEEEEGGETPTANTPQEAIDSSPVVNTMATDSPSSEGKKARRRKKKGNK